MAPTTLPFSFTLTRRAKQKSQKQLLCSNLQNETWKVIQRTQNIRILIVLISLQKTGSEEPKSLEILGLRKLLKETWKINCKKLLKLIRSLQKCLKSNPFSSISIREVGYFSWNENSNLLFFVFPLKSSKFFEKSLNFNPLEKIFSLKLYEFWYSKIVWHKKKLDFTFNFQTLKFEVCV